MNSQPRIKRHNLPNKEGMTKLYFVVNIDKKQERIPLDILVYPDLFNDKTGFVESKHPDADMINTSISASMGKYASISRHYMGMGKTLTAQAFRKEFLSDRDTRDFLSWMRNEIRADKDAAFISDRTAQYYKRSADLLQSYCEAKLKSEMLYFSDLTSSLIQEFTRWLATMYAKKGQKGTGVIRKTLGAIHKYTDKAREDGYKIPNELVVNKVQDRPDPRSPLTKQEVLKLWDYLKSDKITATHYRCLRSFLFQCETGVRHSDALALTVSQYGNQELRFVPQKTKDVKNEEIVIPLSPYAVELISMGEPRTLLGYSLLRGVVKRGALIPGMTNQKSNEILKQVCKAVGIDKNVTTHDGRHTFATLYLEAGGSVEVLQRLMGHSNITTTMIYVHISAERVKTEARRVYENWR